jgi:hypothetical protein
MSSIFFFFNLIIILQQVQVPAAPMATATLVKVEKEEGTQFVLAPTPAQLGKAPLQRRLSKGKTITPQYITFLLKDILSITPTSYTNKEKYCITLCSFHFYTFL